jgi:signal transduction histidine kinase
MGIQLKVALSYIAIIAGVLILLNIYPIIVSQNFIFRSKQDTLQDKTALYALFLSSLDSIDRDSVYKTMEMLDDRGSFRIIVVDDNLRSVYDNSQAENSVGRIILLQEVRRALLGNDIFYASFTDGLLICKAASPIIIDGRATGVVYLYESDADQAALLEDIQRNLTTITFFVSLGVIALSLLLSKFLTRRIGILLHAIRKVREGEYSHRANIKGTDEISDIAREFNELSARFERVENMRRRFVSDASHELKTPLASIKVLADSIVQTRDMPPELIRDFVSDIGEEVNRLTRLTEKLLNITRLDSDVPAEIVRVDVKQLVIRAAHSLTRLAQLDDVEIILELSEGCIVEANEDDIYQIVFNLMENAVKYNVIGGKVKVFLYRKEDSVSLIVSDTGVGIPPEDIERIYERFYRIDKARSREAGGSGLGLAIVQSAVMKLKGTISTDSKVGEGTRITINFPAVSEEGGSQP